MTKKLCLVTLINSVDVIGELQRETGDCDTATLWRPCLVKMTAPNKVELHELLRGSPFLTGEYLELNMRAVLWIGRPTKELETGYRNLKSGLVLPMAQPIGVNQ